MSETSQPYSTDAVTGRLARWAGVAIAVALGGVLSAQQPLPEIDALLQRAAADGQVYLQTRDDRARKSAKESLDTAANLLKNLIKKDRACEICHERQVSVEYYRAYLGFSRNYDTTLDTALAALKSFPRNAAMLYFAGLAHYNKNEFDRATVVLSRFVSAAGPTAPATEQAKQLLADSRQKFLGGWYKQANFYQSPEGRIERYNPQTRKNEVVLQFTPEWELGLGGQALTALTAEAPAVDDPALSAYLNQLVLKLTDKTPGPAFKYQVRVLDSPQINAVTPPGHIIVYAGLLRFVETEAQLAAVLAHELAHNYGHHSARRVTKAYQAQALTNAITQAVKPESATAQAVWQLSTSLGTGLFLKAYSRHEEKEADLYGSHILFNAGYSATELPAFFARLYELNPKQPVKLFSTHPPAPDRVDYLIDYIEGFPLDRESKVSTEEFAKIKLMFPSPSPATVTPGGAARGVAPILPGGAAAPVGPLPAPAPPPPTPPPAARPAETVSAASLPPMSTNLSGAASPPVNGCRIFAGRWDTTRGPMSISADSDVVRGTFSGGEITGRLTDKTLEGRWLSKSANGAVTDAGPFVLKLLPDGTWKGFWSRDDKPGVNAVWDGTCLTR